MRGTHTAAYHAKFAVKRRPVGRSARRAERNVQKNEAEIRAMRKKKQRTEAHEILVAWVRGDVLIRAELLRERRKAAC